MEKFQVVTLNHHNKVDKDKLSRQNLDLSILLIKKMHIRYIVLIFIIGSTLSQKK